MSKLSLLLAVIYSTGVIWSAAADIVTPSHSCSKPYKPYEFNDEWELENFKNDVGLYKQCISDFVDEQVNFSEEHKKAAEEAIEEWNNYVKYEL